MLKSYFKIAFRTLYKNKTHVLINVIGMGIALACCIIAYINFISYLDFDRVYAESKNVYRINSTRLVETKTQHWGVTPLSLGPAAMADIPGVERYSRLNYNGLSMRYQNNVFLQQVAYVDPTFIEMFPLAVKSGNLAVIRDPNRLIISEEVASKFFGNDDPIGKEVTLIFPQGGVERLVTIGAVLKESPENSSFRFQLLVDFNFMMQLEGWQNSEWSHWQQPVNFIQLTDPEQVPSIEKLLQRYVPIQNEARANWMVNRFYLQRFQDMAHNSQDFEETGLNQPPPFQAIMYLAGLAALILLIACFNFTNTTIALSGTRLKEIGIKKIMGAQRRELVRQFLSECLILCGFAIIAGVIFAQLLGQGLYTLQMSVQPTTDLLWNSRMWGFLIGLLIVTGLIAGSYPSLYISSFLPIEIFTGKSKFKGNNYFTRVLLSIQFTASTFTIIAGVMFALNARYQDKIPLGFNTTEIVYMNIPNNARIYEVFSASLLQNPKIRNISYCDGGVGVWAYGALFKGSPQATEEHEVFTINTGSHYFETMDLEIIAGRVFDHNLATDYETTAIINETLLKVLGWRPQEAIGRQVVSDARPYTVIGVVKDFKQYGVTRPIPPIVMHFIMPADRMYSIIVRADKNDLQDVRKFMEEKWLEAFPNIPFGAEYLDSIVHRFDRQINPRMAMLFLFLAVIATILSASGLFALVSLRIVSRTKEIGVRKVLGASLHQLMILISREFAIILTVALLLGTIIGYFASDKLLDQMFAYRISINPVAFIVAFLTITLTAIITVGYKVYMAAMTNPADTLRTE